MLRQSFVFFLIALKVFLGTPFHAAGDAELLLIGALNQEEALVVCDHL